MRVICKGEFPIYFVNQIQEIFKTEFINPNGFSFKFEDKELIQAMNLKADKTQNTKKPVNFSEVLDMFTAKGKKQNAFSESEAAVDDLLGKQ